MAEELADNDPKAAERFRQLASEAAEILAAREERWLRTKFEPAAIVAILLLVAPAVAIVILAWDWQSDLKIPVIVAASIWAVVWTVAGLTQLRQEQTETSSS